jgi:copper(I)-binding protein
LSTKRLVALAAGILSFGVAAQQEPVLEFEDAWIRVLPPAKTNTAAYLTVTNRSAGAVAIVGGSSEAAGSVEIHTTREVDGYMRMERLPGLALAAGEEVNLAPGGTHLMLLDLVYMPDPGEFIALCLKLASGQEVCTEAEARKTAPASGAQNHQHHH